MMKGHARWGHTIVGIQEDNLTPFGGAQCAPEPSTASLYALRFAWDCVITEQSRVVPCAWAEDPRALNLFEGPSACPHQPDQHIVEIRIAISEFGSPVFTRVVQNFAISGNDLVGGPIPHNAEPEPRTGKPTQ